ncbi:MAG: hypothetical protein K9H16_12215 [Bacteroidales bacterium]|nr:hypothetical protein [Bacteroidales bacterium]
MKKNTFIFPLFFLMSILAIAQQKDSSNRINPYSGNQQPKKVNTLDKLYFGGTLYFTLGSGYTSIGVWPLAGYKVTPKLSVGIQPGYEYLKYNIYGGKFETSNYGVRIFTRYRIIPQAYAHVEFADINYGQQYQNSAGDIVEERNWVPFLFVGGGLSQPLGGSAFAYVQVLYDVLQDKNSPYGSSELFWSVGVVAGF